MDSVGLLVIVAVLVVGIAVGLWRHRTDGRFRASKAGPTEAGPTEAGPTEAGPTEAGPTKAGPTKAGPVRAGPVRAEGEDQRVSDERLDGELLAALGVAPAQATLLQFSSAFCAPCRAVRRVSAEVAAMVPGVQHVEVDAESHLDEVRALNIWRTPTLLVLDVDGRVTKRATGVPSKPQLIAAVGEVLTG